MTEIVPDSRAEEIDRNLLNDRVQKKREKIRARMAEKEIQNIQVEQQAQKEVESGQATQFGADPLKGAIKSLEPSKKADAIPDVEPNRDRLEFDGPTNKFTKFAAGLPATQFMFGQLDGISEMVNAGQDVVEGLFGIENDSELGNIIPKFQEDDDPFIRALGQFFAPFKVVQSTTKALGFAKNSKKLKAVVDGMVADFAAFDPEDGNLAAVIAENSRLAAPVAELLANGKDTPAIRGRINNALEGVIAGKLIDKFIDGVKFYGARKRVNTYRKWRAEQKFEDQPDIEFPNEPRPKKKQLKTTGFVRDINDQFGINYGKIDSERDIKRLIATLRKQDEEQLGNILQDLSRKDLKAHAAKEVADNAEKSIDDILKIADGKDLKLSRKDQMVARILSVSSAKYFQNISEMAVAGVVPEQEVDRAFLLFTKLQRAKSLFQADSSRRVGDLQESVGAAEKATQEFADNLSVDLAKRVEESGLPVSGMRLAERVVALPSAAAREKFFDDLAGPSGLRMFEEIWLNALLTGPKTHMTNMLSNTLANLNEFTLEKFLTASIDTLRRAPADERAYFGEISASFMGMRETLGESFRFAKAVWKERKKGFNIVDAEFADLGGVDNVKLEGFVRPEATTQNLNKMLRRFQRKMNVPEGEFMEIKEENFFAHMLDASFQLWRNLGGSALVSSDAFFKSMAYRMQVNSAAYRLGKSQGLSGKKLTEFIVDQRQKPNELIRMEAQDMAEYLTFTKALGKRGKSVQNLVEANPELRFVLPFVRTPMNLNKYAFERFPGLNMAVKESREALFPHGLSLDSSQWTKQQRMARSRSLARLSQGALLASVAYNIAETQMNNPDAAEVAVSGSGPVGGNAKGSRDVLKAAKIQNDSIAFKDEKGKWHQWSFDRNDPYGMVFGMAVDLHAFRNDLDEHGWGEAAQAFSLALSRQMLSKTWATNFRNLMDALLSPERNTGKYWNNLFGSVVPRLIAETSGYIDPTLRETRSMFDEIKKNIPILRETLEPKLDVLARPRSKQRNNLLDAVLPTERSTKVDDPIVKEMLNIGLNFHTIGDTLTTNGIAIELTPRQKNWLIREVVENHKEVDPTDNKRKNFKEMMLSTIKRNDYKFADGKNKATNFQKAQHWQDTYNAYKDAVIHSLKFRNEFPRLASRIEELKDEKVERETGQSRSAFTGGFSGTLLPR